MTLEDLLTLLSSLDDAPEVDFDPAEIVGDLKDKVDRIHTVLGRLKAEAERLEDIQNKVAAAKLQVMANGVKLQEYVRLAMEKNGYEKLPGEIFRVQIQSGRDSVQVERKAGAEDFLNDPDLVKRDVKYSWKKDEIREKLLSGVELKDMKLKPVKFIKWYVQKKD